jgi:hypothetical protein
MLLSQQVAPENASNETRTKRLLSHLSGALVLSSLLMLLEERRGS